MTQPVFGHGRLRLYLLKLLAEQPRHGYEIIRVLEDHFQGMYAPSAGTIYPRLARLESDGLVTQRRERGRKVYHLTDAGLAELRSRQDEVDTLEAEMDVSAASLADLANEIHQGVRQTVKGLKHDFQQVRLDLTRDLKQSLRQAALEATQHAWPLQGGRALREDVLEEVLKEVLEDHDGDHDGDEEPGEDAGRDRRDRGGRKKATPGPDPRFERLLGEFRRQARRLQRGVTPTEAQLGECVAILDEALDRLGVALDRDR